MAKEKKEKKEEKEEKTISPSQYFDFIKGTKNTITTEALKDSYDVFIQLAEKYNEPKELHRSQIEDVVKYDVDTITTISGRDTTRTYTIYYYKY